MKQPQLFEVDIYLQIQLYHKRIRATCCQQRRHRRRHCDPGRQARDAARQEAWRKRRLESQQPRQPPPLPPVESSAGDIALSPVKSPEKQNDPGPPGRRPFKCEMQLLLRHQAQSERA